MAAKNRPPHPQTAQEFLYYDVRVPSANGPDRWRSLPHRVIKRTPKYVYIAATPEAAGDEGEAWRAESCRTIRLDRRHLEQWGYAFVSFGDAERHGLEEPLFYTMPYAMRAGAAFAGQECFTLLELQPPYTIDAVKQAYRRLAKQHHPDRGGIAERFLALQTAYRQALEMLMP